MRAQASSIFLISIISLIGCSHVRPVPDSGESFTWIEAAPGGRTLVRTLTGANNCPALTVAGVAGPTVLRAGGTKEFPQLTCEREVPSGVPISLAGRSLPIFPKSPRRIVVIGDTGCRIKKSKQGSYAIQACNDPEKWAFGEVAKSAAEFRPDLVIHVGDYHYREGPCTPGTPECTGIITGDRWEAWRDDFFIPAAPLLKIAPWVFVRGNHELCKRAGLGWNRFLDPHPLANCADRSEPYILPFPNVTLGIIDSADDGAMGYGLGELGSMVTNRAPLWVITHRPFLTTGVDNETEYKVALPAKSSVRMVISGHTHLSSINRFSDGRPPEIISGNGGTALQAEVKFSESPATKISLFRDFGFITLEEIDSRGGYWLLNVRNRKGDSVNMCHCHFTAEKQTVITCDR
jgi:Calcineurin-like phosphoesterase